jgi:hypothetical protein
MRCAAGVVGLELRNAAAARTRLDRGSHHRDRIWTVVAEIAAELVRLKVAVIVMVGSAVPAAKQATSAIPIVFAPCCIDRLNPLSWSFSNSGWIRRWPTNRPQRPDCLAGYVGFELTNPSASHLIGIAGQFRPRSAQTRRRRFFPCQLLVPILQLWGRFKQTIFACEGGPCDSISDEQPTAFCTRLQSETEHEWCSTDAEPSQSARSSDPASAIGPPRGLGRAARCCAVTRQRSFSDVQEHALAVD